MAVMYSFCLINVLLGGYLFFSLNSRSGIILELGSIILFSALFFICRKKSKRKRTEHLLKMAYTDPQTGLENRKSFDYSGELDFLQMKREGKELGVLKMLTDHSTPNDELLAALGKALQSRLRAADKISRYSEDQFIVLLKGAGPENSLRIAEEIRREVEAMGSYDVNGSGITLSLGVAHLTEEDCTLSSIIDRADKALNFAVEAGGNCVKDDQNSSVVVCEI